MSDHLSVQRDYLELKADDNLKFLGTKLEELIAQFHGAGFAWYEAHLRKVLEGIRRREEINQLLEDRKRAGNLIDPATAKVTFHWAEVLDPYGVPNVPEEYNCVGRSYFARSSESDNWVSFYDLPKATVQAFGRESRPENSMTI
jgi:hypothetical protein